MLTSKHRNFWNWHVQRGSTKRSKERQGSTLCVHLREVSMLQVVNYKNYRS